MLQVHELVDCLGRNVYVLRGEIVGTDADGLRQRFDTGHCPKHPPGAVLDLREVDAVDDGGVRAIRAIAAAYQASGLSLELCNVGQRLRPILPE